jgi:hypothetical protein
MAKEHYELSYKTYFNSRLKPVSFHGEETFPVYIQMTFDRRTVFFKSYFFDLFARPKYDFLKMSTPRIEKMEMETVGRIIDRQTDHFDLSLFLRQYKILTACLLDTFDAPFQSWLSAWLQKEGLPGLSALVHNGTQEIAAIRIWVDLEKCLQPAIWEKLTDASLTEAPAYIPLVTYVRHRSPKGPFCLPLLDWSDEQNRLSIEDFFDNTFGDMRVDFGKLLRKVRLAMHPDGIE